MYAVFKTGGKQYRATQGQKVKLEKINANSGDKVLFTEVLMVGEGSDIEIGTPFLINASVEAKVLEEGKDKKIDVIKFKRRKNYKRNFGHRQCYTLVEITGIKVKKETKPKTKKAAPKTKIATVKTKKAAPKTKKKTKTTKKTSGSSKKKIEVND